MDAQEEEARALARLSWVLGRWARVLSCLLLVARGRYSRPFIAVAYRSPE